MTYRPADPYTGEQYKPVRPGVSIFSKTIFHAEGGSFPIGGTVVDSYTDRDGTEMFKVAAVHRGTVVYNTIAAPDIDAASYNGEVHVRSCETLAKKMHEEMARKNSRADHLHALLAMSHAIETRGVKVA